MSDDKVLVEQTLAGETESFETLVRKYEQRLREKQQQEKHLKQAKEELLNVVAMINREKSNLSEIQKKLTQLKKDQQEEQRQEQRADRHHIQCQAPD